MIRLESKADCCGCGTCAAICPKRAIAMKEDEHGFLYPSVDTSLCVECGLCEQRCPVLRYEAGYSEEHTVYAAYAKDPAVRWSGSSGGMFGVLARQVIGQGGAVYGAAFDADLHLRCRAAESEEELLPLYKSKYLQSDAAPAFGGIKERLERGERVLFVATPCQVQALKLFLGKEYETLLTVDFLCHGVPSQSLFDRCKEYVERREGIKILSYRFRTKKKNGATPHYYTLTYQKGEKIKERVALYTQSPFYYGFQRYITLRDSCYACRFAHTNRCSDITIGDFHTVDRHVTGINRFDGVSTVCINTERGRAFFASVVDQLVTHPVDFKQLYDSGELMPGATKMPKGREAFLADLASEPFDTVVQKHLCGKREYGKRLYYAMPSAVRRLIKRIMGIES